MSSYDEKNHEFVECMIIYSSACLLFVAIGATTNVVAHAIVTVRVTDKLDNHITSNKFFISQCNTFYLQPLKHACVLLIIVIHWGIKNEQPLHWMILIFSLIYSIAAIIAFTIKETDNALGIERRRVTECHEIRRNEEEGRNFESVELESYGLY